MTDREKQYCDLRAKKYLKQIDDRFKQHKLYFGICVIKNKCCILCDKFVGYLDEDTDSLLWYVKSFLKGFRVKLFLVMTASMLIAELPFVIQLLKSKFDVADSALKDCLFSSLPALVGITLLDYILENLGKTVLLAALLSLGLVGALGWYFQSVDASLKGMYIVTGVITFLVWCIKARDPKVTRNIDPSQLLPKEDSSRTEGVSPKKWKGKPIFT